MKYAFFLLVSLCIFSGIAQTVDFRNFQIPEPARKRENIVWNTTYSYNARDRKSPRVLLVGDSICNGYQAQVRTLLGAKVNVTFWATSLCITDQGFLRMFDVILEDSNFDLVIFNNGLHSLSTPKDKWYKAYTLALQYMAKRLPETKIILLNSTPKADRDKRVDEINKLTSQAAREYKLELADIHALCAKWDKKAWRDNYHFRNPEKKLQAQFIADTVIKNIPESRFSDKLVQQSSETGPDGKLR